MADLPNLAARPRGGSEPKESMSAFFSSFGKQTLKQPLLDEEAAAQAATGGLRRIPASERMQRYLEAGALTADKSNP